MGRGGGDRGDGQVIAITSSHVGGVVDAVKMVVVSSHTLDGRVGGDVCDEVVELGGRQRRSFFRWMG